MEFGYILATDMHHFIVAKFEKALETSRPPFHLRNILEMQK